MICGLAGAIGILVIEMTLFIVRAIQVEEKYDKPSEEMLRVAQSRSGSLITAQVPPSKKSATSTAIKDDLKQGKKDD